MSEEILNEEKTLDEKIKELQVDLLEPIINEEPKKEPPVLIFEPAPNELGEKKTENHTPVFDAPIINVPPTVEPVKNRKKERDEARNKMRLDKKTESIKKENTKVTMAVIFSVEESEKVLEVFEARKEAGLSIDRNHFFRQIIQFACNAHNYKNPKFGMPEGTIINLQNTY